MTEVKAPEPFGINRLSLQIIASTLSIFCLLSASLCFSASDFEFEFESDGLFAHQILIGVTAKTLGMGSASVAASAEADSLFWNPSALSLTDRLALSLSNVPFSGDSDSNSEAAGGPHREAGLSFALPLQNLQLINKNFKNLGVFGFSSWLNGWGGDLKKDRVIAGGYGVKLWRGFSAGIDLRHHRRNRNNSNGIGWGLGLGVLYSRDLVGILENLSIGASAEDLRAKIKWDGGINQALPTSLKFGVATRPDSDTLLAADWVYRDDHKFVLQDRFRAHLGVERWFWGGKFGFRFGYTGITSYDRFVHGEWSRGLSLNTESGQIDYAYIKGSKGSQLDRGTHWITATLRWGGPSNDNDLIGNVEKVEKVEKGESKDKDKDKFKSLTPKISPPITGHPVQTDQPLSDLLDMDRDKETSRPKDSEKSARTDKTDMQTPEVAIFAEPLLISPENLKPRPSALINQSAYAQNGISKWRLEIYNKGRELVGSFSGESEPPKAINWDQWQVVDQEYRCVLSVEDKAGNASSSETTLYVIDVTGLGIKSEERGITASLPDSIFVYKGEEVHQEASDLIGRVAYLIKAYRDAQVLIEVYSDDQKLSESRAKNLSNYVSNRYKIEAKRLIAVGKVGAESAESAENRTDIVILSEEGETQIQPERPRDSAKKYTVLAGSFKSRENAEDLAEVLRLDVVEHQVKLQRITLSSGVWYRVVVGEFSNELEAKAVADAVSKLQSISCIVIRVSLPSTQ